MDEARDEGSVDSDQIDDFSEDGSVRFSKKDSLLSSKRKEKKDSKKDKGYASLAGDSSPEDLSMDAKSPFKSKKKSFKFSASKKEKDKEGKKEKEKEILDSHESLRSKDSKEATDKDKKAKKEKDKDYKSKSKIKDKKKVKTEVSEEDELPVFGVTLEVAVERSHCHDGVLLPTVVRDCIDYIEAKGLECEGIYRVSGVKSKVLELRTAYNLRLPVSLEGVDPPTVTSLLKQYIRELPEPLLTNQLMSQFEEASAIKDGKKQLESLQTLIDKLPACNKLLLAWLFVHLGHVIEKERFNKMNLQSLSIVFSPTMRLSHRVLNALFTQGPLLFADTTVTKYVPPISGMQTRGALELPEGLAAIEAELRKQESLLNQIHAEMNVGMVTKQREEQLWEAQRIVTQLKRKLKHAQKMEREVKKIESVDEDLKLDLATPQTPAQPPVGEIAAVEVEVHEQPAEKEVQEGNVTAPLVEQENNGAQETESHVTVIEVKGVASEDPLEHAKTADFDEEAFMRVEIEEREKYIASLQQRLYLEKRYVNSLKEQAAKITPPYIPRLTEEEMEAAKETLSEEDKVVFDALLKEQRKLEEANAAIIAKIIEGREACLMMRVELKLLEG